MVAWETEEAVAPDADGRRQAWPMHRQRFLCMGMGEGGWAGGVGWGVGWRVGAWMGREGREDYHDQSRTNQITMTRTFAEEFIAEKFILFDPHRACERKPSNLTGSHAQKRATPLCR